MNKELYLKKLNELEEIIESSEESDYLIESTYMLYKALVDNDQFIDYVPEKPEFSRKLLRIYGYKPSSYLDYKKVDRIVFGGLYAMTDVCLIPKKLVDEATENNRWRAIMDPEQHGLPSFEKVDYGTLKQVSPHLMVALTKDSWTYGDIKYTTQYDYVTLS